MISLQKLKKDRASGADRIVVPKKVSEENIGTLQTDEVAQTLVQRLFPFTRCLIDFEDDNSHTYFELTDANEAAIIRDTNANNVYFAAVIQLDTVHISEIVEEGIVKYQYHVPDIRLSAFCQDKRVRLTARQTEEAKKTLGIELLSILCVFTYINKVCLNEPKLETKTVKTHSKRHSKSKKTIRYISTRKYVLTGQERKSRSNIPKVYTRERWQVRGHWRTYKNGKRVWIKPHESKRDKNKLSGKCVDDRVYKVGK